MVKPRPTRSIHLVSVAGSCRGMLRALGCASAAELLKLFQKVVGKTYRVTGDHTLIEASEAPLAGGRSDDALRAKDITRALADDRVACVLSLRGGSWLTRILPLIDFDVLRQRKRRVSLFGFSELTTLMNIASCYAKAVCWYDMGPAFIPAGLADAAKRGVEPDAPTEPVMMRAWVREQFPVRLAEFMTDVVAMIEGRESTRPIVGELVRGSLARRVDVKIVGGALSVLLPLIGSPYGRRVFRPGRWLAMEDVNEAPHRIDRMIAHLKLSGVLDRCGGLLVGDFHDEHADRIDCVLASLERVLLKRSKLPVIVSRSFGHTWPMSPLLLNRPVEFVRNGDRVDMVVPWRRLASV